jgi:mannose-6-phosphate isomerase-like protein (cupin superfamily)
MPLAPPISGDMPRAPYALERRHACNAPLCRFDGFVPDPSFLKSPHDGQPAKATIWLQGIAGKSAVVMPAAEALDGAFLVLDGHVATGQGDPKKEKSPWVMPPWTAVKTPNLGYFLEARGGPATVLMMVFASSEGLAEGIARGPLNPINLSRVGLEVSGGPELNKIAKLSWQDNAYHARIVRFGAAMSLTLLQLSGQGALPVALHDKEWEHIAFLRGKGEMQIGNSKHPITPGSIFHVPPGTLHGWKATGDEIAAVVFYAPAGPEQRFQHLGTRPKPPPAGPRQH